MASKLSHRFLVIWTALAAVGGCGQVLGLSDYDIDPKLDRSGEGGRDGTNGGETSDAGKSTTAGTAGTGQPGGDAGAGAVASGGQPDTTSVGGSGGEGGAAPDAKFKGCDGTPFEGNEAVVRSCILRVGCQLWTYPSDSISRCVSQNAQATYEGTKCTLDATSCADITACEGTRLETTFCGSGASKKKGMYCVGNEVVDCDGYRPYARDCTKEGGTCYDFGVDIDGNGTTVDCQLPAAAGATCTDSTTEKQCTAAGYAYRCEGTIAYGSKCSNFAASCEDVGSGFGCYYPLNDCMTEGVTCANDRATWCDGDSKAVFDCGSVGLGCQTQGDYATDTNRQCTAPGCGPDELASCQESCSGGNMLHFCYGGAPVTVDCRDYGFTKCKTYDYDCSTLGMNDCVQSSDTISFAECE